GLRRQPEQDGVFDAGPAVLLGEPDPEHSHGAQLALDVPREIGPAGTLAVAGRQNLLCEAGEPAPEVLLLLGEREGDQLDRISWMASTNIFSSSPRCRGTMAPPRSKISSRWSLTDSADISRSVIPL